MRPSHSWDVLLNDYELYLNSSNSQMPFLLMAPRAEIPIPSIKGLWVFLREIRTSSTPSPVRMTAELIQLILNRVKSGLLLDAGTQT